MCFGPVGMTQVYMEIPSCARLRFNKTSSSRFKVAQEVGESQAGVYETARTISG